MKRMARPHRLDRRMRGWIINTARRHFWRVARWYELDDLIQDGFMVYARCEQRYPRSISPQNFMALVQVSFVNHIHNLAARRTAEAAETLLDFDCHIDYGRQLDALGTPDAETSTLRVLLGSLPAELRRLLQTLMTDARDLPYLQRGDGTRETTNEYLCRLAGVDPATYNIEERFREHFA